MNIVSIEKAPKEVLEKALADGWKLHTPNKPFQAGFICQLVDKNIFNNRASRFGACTMSTEDSNLILSVCGGKYDLAKLRFYLAQECNISSPDNMTMGEIITILKEKEAVIKEPKPQVQKSQNPKKYNGKLDSRATACLIEHPNWTNKQIADAIGCHANSLSDPKRVPNFMKSRAIQRQDKKNRPKGYKDTKGNIDAW